MKIIFYDLGLSANSRKLLQKHCKCEYRAFPFHEYPSHVSTLNTFTWKPIIVQLVLKQYPSVIWADSSVRFINPTLETMFANPNDVGIKTIHGGGAIAKRTQLETFEYLDENPCLFDVPEREVTVMFFKRSRFILTYIMRPWVSCALSTGCMSHPCSTLIMLCTAKYPVYGCCHRFDQSIMGILLTRLFHNYTGDMLRINTSQIKIDRDDHYKYFDDLESRMLNNSTSVTTTCILLLCVMIVTTIILMVRNKTRHKLFSIKR